MNNSLRLCELSENDSRNPFAKVLLLVKKLAAITNVG